LEASEKCVDGDDLVVYEDFEGGLWARPAKEFVQKFRKADTLDASGT
jgi:hypothetical protein